MVGTGGETLGTSVATLLAEFFLNTKQYVVPTLRATISEKTRKEDVIGR